MIEFKPIATAPIGVTSANAQILCRFWNERSKSFTYMVAYPNGADTFAPGYARPTEWAELQITRDDAA